ncbi:hypothetical protein [Streptosporangium roseum]|uniref:Uncharacterized protein n=1 Tax=Streptosporangium roseum (strain ATCC 12428 / DSM 43021 / JCM 3005 / KCTC 9067 / NCIMB 10171 / NRRL 2505 / NI 9100) TaxID=479432 RepID=D2BFW3_STRRD|nr:hypothetical protein [Streptosporangium roseum]ACZ92015.1 hypothetical protein Sros_9397 [Streptosporangium roseum DSM 43021]
MTIALTSQNAKVGEDLALIIAEYVELLAAARATVAAAALGEVDPLVHVRHALAAHGQLPPAGARPVVLLAQCAVPALPALSRAEVA